MASRTKGRVSFWLRNMQHSSLSGMHLLFCVNDHGTAELSQRRPLHHREIRETDHGIHRDVPSGRTRAENVTFQDDGQ